MMMEDSGKKVWWPCDNEKKRKEKEKRCIFCHIIIQGAIGRRVDTTIV